MSCKLFVFRHAETFDNYRGIFSGWRDSKLTSKGRTQAQKINTISEKPVLKGNSFRYRNVKSEYENHPQPQSPKSSFL
jgi:bisphosphoglycerate-dependent phosphoglycerate mutase